MQLESCQCFVHFSAYNVELGFENHIKALLHQVNSSHFSRAFTAVAIFEVSKLLLRDLSCFFFVLLRLGAILVRIVNNVNDVLRIAD